MIPVELNWGPIVCDECETCICSTLVQYRQQGVAEFSTPLTPDNPTQELKYIIDIEPGIYYQVRLTFIGPRCKQKYTELSLFYASNTCCPEGYSLSTDGEYCYKIEDISATPPTGEPQLLNNIPNIAYGSCGTYIYNLGWNNDGTGASTQIPLSNTFWVNGAGNCISGTSTGGPLNRTGVWVTPAINNQDIGFSVCINITEEKVYYVGVGADNKGTIKLDGQVRLNQNVVALSTQYGLTLSAPFKVWHIYPITLSVGPHILEILGHNDETPASIGCEIYNATAGEITAATSYTDLGNKLVFSSKDYIGQEVQIGTQGAGYTCPDGYSLATCSEPVVCRKIIKSEPMNC